MTKEPKWRFRLTFRGKLLSGFVWVDLGGELLVKPMVASVRKHLSIFSSGGKLQRHVTHEEYQLGQKRRHTQRDEIAPEELLNPMLWALAPPDDPLPWITSFVDKDQVEALTKWFAQIWPRLFRKTTDASVCVIKGPLGALLDGVFGTPLPQNFDLDFEPLVSYYGSVEKAEDVYETIRESDLRLDGRRIVFGDDWSKFIVLVGEDTVLKLDVERMEAAVEENLRTLGFTGFFRSLRRTGNTLFDERAVGEARKALPPQS